MTKRDERVDAYIEKAAEFAKPILNHLRDVVHSASPQIEETIKWGFPHFTHNGMLCSMAAFKQHCAFGFWKADAIPGLKGAAGDAMGQFGRISAVSDLPTRKVLCSYVQEAIRLNEAGAQTRAATTRPRRPLEMHAAFGHALAQHPGAEAAFNRFSPSQQREYIEWINEAKREATRDRRIATAVEWIASGKPRHWKYRR